jgi:hypothetical protein
MQLKLFQWETIETGEGYQNLGRLYFVEARRHFAEALVIYTDHQGALRGLRVSPPDRTGANPAPLTVDGGRPPRVEGSCAGDSGGVFGVVGAGGAIKEAKLRGGVQRRRRAVKRSRISRRPSITAWIMTFVSTIS